MTELGRILDPDRQAPPGPRGRLTLEVPAAWLEQGATVELTMPRRIACAGCDGGGCDGCSRSGAYKLDDDGQARTLELTLPRTEDRRVLVRLIEPFGSENSLAELSIEVRAASAPSHDCRRIQRELAPARPRFDVSTLAVLLLIVIALTIAVSAARR